MGKTAVAMMAIEPRDGADSSVFWARSNAVPPDLEAYLVMDNCATHKTEPVRKWPAARPRWHVHFTTTASSWVNQVERFFAAIAEKQIRCGVHRSTADLETAIRAYLEAASADPKRFCLKTLDIAAAQAKI